MDGRRFDDLTRRLVGKHSRRDVLRGLGAAVLGGIGAGWFRGSVDAASNVACAHWCSANLSGSERGRCTSDAARGRGVCHDCGAAAPANNGLQFSGGACVPVCPAPADACHVQGVWVRNARACTNPPAPAGTPCDDHNACTQSAACDGRGACVGSNPITCTALDQCHDVGTCNPLTGVCDNPPTAVGTPCNDENACTRTDACDGHGACVGGNPIVCTALDQCHDVGTCNPLTGVCDNPNKRDGSSCNDGHACTTGDSCQAGECISGSPTVCTTGNPCLTASCDPALGCVTTPKASGTSCGDGNVCNGDETCDGAGNCQAGTTVTICVDACFMCDPISGVCVPNPARIGQSCPGDGNHCFGAHQCNASGACVGVQPVVCTAKDPCHDVGVCDPGSGLCSNPDKPPFSSCDDGNHCTTIKFCQSGVCQSQGVVNCPPDFTNTCRDTSGNCNPATGQCEYRAFSAGSNCSSSENFPCTQSTCDGAGSCVEGPSVCDSECQFCNQTSNACGDIPASARVLCDEHRGYCGGGTCVYPCGEACKDACYLTTGSDNSPQGYFCCAVLDANGNCCWSSNQYGTIVDGVCQPTPPPQCCQDGSCPELCSFNHISRCC